MTRKDTSFQRGRSQYLREQLEQADDALAEVAPGDPDYPAALSMRSKIAMKQGRVEDAHRLLRTLVTAHPESFDEYDQRRYDEAFSSLVVTREFDVPGQVRHVAAQPGRLAVLTAEAKTFSVTAIDLETGRPTWSHRLGTGASQRYDEKVAIAGAHVLAIASAGSSTTNDVLALDAVSGEEVWRHPIGSVQAGAGFSNTGETVAVPVNRKSRVDGEARRERGIELVDIATSKPRWRADTDAAVATLCLMGERVYSRDRHGVIRSHDQAEGHEVWRLDFGPKVEANEQLVCDQGMLWLVASDGRVHALDSRDEPFDAPLDRVRWSAEAGSGASVAVDEGTVYLPQSGELAMLSVRDGTVLSRVPHGVRDKVSSRALPVPRARLLRDEDLVLLGYRTSMLALDREGHVRWKLSGRHLSSTPLAVVDGHVYAGAADTGTDSSPTVVEIPLRPNLPY